MKYGKLLCRAKMLTNPSWNESWIDYKKLKKIIKLIVRSTSLAEDEPRLSMTSISSSDDEEKEGTADRKVDTKTAEKDRARPASVEDIQEEKMFFKELTFQLLKVSTFYDEKEKEILSRTKTFLKELKVAEVDHAKKESATVEEKKCRFLVMNRLIEQCKMLHVDQMMLENYAVMNYGGFAKILKKHDKVSDRHIVLL